MNSLKTLLPYARRHKWALIFGVVFVFGANALAPLVPTIIGQAVNLAERRQITSDGLLTFAVLSLCIAGLAAAFRFLMRRVIIDVSRDIEYEYRNDFFAKLQSLDPAFFDSNNTGDLMSRATNDMDLIRMLLGPAVLYSANTIFSLPLTLVWMFLLDWKLTILAIIPMAGLTPLVKFFSSRTYKMSKRQQDAFGDMTTTVQENLAGIRVVKAYRQEDAQERKFLERNDEYIDASLKLARLQSFFFPSIHVLIGTGFLILLVFGGYQIIHDRLEVGTLLSFLILFGMIIWPLIAAGWVINLIQRGMASLDRVNSVFESQSLVVEPTTTPKELPQSMAISVRGLTFQYDGTQSPQLSDINLEVPAGKTVGIVGPVGSGKSTLVHLLARFYPVKPGMIEMGGIDINDWPIKEVRRRIAFVFQETFLFSDTIGWNIRFGSDEDAAQERVEKSATMAHVHPDIMEFPQKYDTVLGERGVNLSGGQKQRVSIARALLRDAEVLILDDSLSAVDTHTEEAILSDLRSVMAGRTTFLISHRISTVALADEIIVVEEGRITQRGTHEQLIAMEGGLYAELYRKQLSEDKLDEEFEESQLEGESVS